jgi:branched-chain amino acid aminotransferase
MPPMPKADKIWFNGELLDWDDAQIHVLSHVVHYGSSVFEGMRVYETPKGPACFRLTDHVNRIFDSAKIYRMALPYTKAQLTEAILETIRANKLKSCYVRPIAFRGYGSLGVDPTPCPVDVVVAVWEWGAYLGADALEKGADVRVASWNRPAPNTMPSLAKVGANYMNSQLIKMEAMADGYAEGIALDSQGYVSEASGENIFMVKNGSIYTPSSGSSILPGESLYIADEVFFTGSAAEVTPIASIDHIPVGDGKRGPMTEALQSAYFGITYGREEDRFGWLTYV